MVTSASAPSATTAPQFLLERQLPGQKGITAPICPANKKGEIQLPRLDFLG